MTDDSKPRRGLRNPMLYLFSNIVVIGFMYFIGVIVFKNSPLNTPSALGLLAVFALLPLMGYKMGGLLTIIVGATSIGLTTLVSGFMFLFSHTTVKASE